MHIDLKEITPVLSVAGIVSGVVLAFDYVLKDEYKQKVFRLYSKTAQIGRNPFSLTFYGLTTIVSIGFTAIIISLNGTMGFAREGTGAWGQALKSIGPLLTAAFLKIVILDYLFAVKTHWLVRQMDGLLDKNAPAVRFTFFFVSGLLDVVITAIITSWFLNASTTFQSETIGNSPATPAPSLAHSVSSFFNSLDFVVTDSIRNAFYVLNGTTFMYISRTFGHFASGFGRFISVADVEKHIFRITAAVLMFIVLTVCLANQLAQ